jgi:hypothetical protein
LFTNFSLCRQDGYLHANNFLAQLHKGSTYWEDPHLRSNSSGMVSAHNNPLQLLFSHPHLKWGWYVFLAAVVLYLVFRSKREQRIIPLMPVNANSSIEYTKAIGTLYFKNKGHHHIANEMYIIFLSEVRSRYNISTDMAEEELTDQLSLRSGLSKRVLASLFKKFGKARQNEAGENDLLNLYDAIEYYHKKRK